jgi:hypothetical protein
MQRNAGEHCVQQLKLKSDPQQQSTNFQECSDVWMIFLPLNPPQRARLPQARCACGGQGGQHPPVSPSASPPSASTLCVRRTGGDSIPLYSPQRRGQESTPLGFCRTCRSGRLPDRSRMANCRTEVRPTFLTLSPFTKGDAFRCRQATERRGLWCSAVELKSDPQQQSTNFPECSDVRMIFLPPSIPHGEGDSLPACHSASPPSASTLCVRRTGRQPPPVSPSASPPSASTLCVRRTGGTMMNTTYRPPFFRLK